MKTTTKKEKIITDTDFEGPMMVYNPMTKKQEHEIAQWVKDQKAINNKKSTGKVSK
jgi:hypothetical protein